MKLLGALLILFWLATVFLNSDAGGESGPRYLNPPPEQAERFHFGFRESMADSYWLRWIQDSDTCQVYGRSLEILRESPEEAGRAEGNSDRLTHNPRHKVCDGSWGFKILDTVTKLAPKFKIPYLLGASALSVLVEDYAGATVIYQRGLAEYPDDWELLYRAAYHYQFDLGDLKTAADYLNRAAQNGAPTWLMSLASRLYTRTGQLELGLSVLESFRKTIEEDNKEALESVDRRIRALKAQLESSARP